MPLSRKIMNSCLLITSVMAGLRDVQIGKLISIQGVALVGREITLGKKLNAVIVPLVTSGSPKVTGKNGKAETQKWVEDIEWNGNYSLSISEEVSLKVSGAGRLGAL
jgi:hypothetical protein